MKFPTVYWEDTVAQSPSIRREWIEMPPSIFATPSCQSPSIRREWIEIFTLRIRQIGFYVSLHTEGVD